MKKGWTRKSYDALYNWIDKTKRPLVKKILLDDGLDDVVTRLEAAENLGEWYKITHEAVAAVGPRIVRHPQIRRKKNLMSLLTVRDYALSVVISGRQKSKIPNSAQIAKVCDGQKSRPPGRGLQPRL